MLAWWEIILRTALAMVLGGLIGWEREVRQKPAGLRTLLLVSLSSAIFVIAAEQAALRYGEPVETVRAMSGIAQGIGFLGAGAIVQSRGKVRWLTTAAALWAAAALGFAAGIGMYFVAIVGAAMVFIVLRWLAVAERRWLRFNKEEPPSGERENKADSDSWQGPTTNLPWPGG